MDLAVWAPNMNELAQAIQTLHALRDPTRSDHKQTVENLAELTKNATYILLVLHIFARGQLYESNGLTPDLRQLAGFIVKNYVFPKLKLLDSSMHEQLQKEILHALSDPIQDIRNTAAILFGRISEAYPIDVWINFLQPLVQMLDISLEVQHSVALDGASQAVQRICEDSCEKLSMDTVRRPLDSLVPRLIGLFRCTSEVVRQRSIESINTMIFLIPSSQRAVTEYNADGSEVIANVSASQNALLANMPMFIQSIGSMANDSCWGVRRAVCQAFVKLSYMHLPSLEPFYANVCEVALHAVMDSRQEVAAEGCEFWFSMFQNVQSDLVPAHMVTMFFPRLIPSLLERLVLTQEQLSRELVEEEELASGDKPLSFQQLHHYDDRHAKKQEEKDSQEVQGCEMTIRQQAANCFDRLAVCFEAEQVLPHALPVVQVKMQSNSVWQQESGLLALGALSQGCLEAMAACIGQLLPHLLQVLALPQAASSGATEPEPELRSICCWVVSRYCSLLFEPESGLSGCSSLDPSTTWFVLVLGRLLECLRDDKPKVQCAACSALCVLVEAAGEEMLPHVDTLFRYIDSSYDVFGLKSRALLLDVIGTVADVLGSDGLLNPALTPLYLPRLTQWFVSLDNCDMTLFPVMECLSSVLAVIELESQQVVVVIYKKCLSMITDIMSALSLLSVKPKNSSPAHGHDDGYPAGHDDDEDVPNKDFVICALDIIGSISNAYKHHFDTLTADSINTLLTALFSCLHDNCPEVRQSAFGLAGEMSHHCAVMVEPQVVSVLFEAVMANIDVSCPAVASNAYWTVGEVLGRLDRAASVQLIQPIFNRIMQEMIHVLQNREESEEYQEVILANVVLTMSKLALVCTDVMAALAPEFFAPWCRELVNVASPDERNQAFMGLVSVLLVNPALLTSGSQASAINIHAFVVACASWEDAPTDDKLLAAMSQVLGILKNNHNSSWKVALTGLKRANVAHLHDMFRLN